MDVASRFGENLSRCRRRADLSQDRLAQMAALHRTEISLLERGIRVPRLDTLLKLAGALSISPGKLLDGIVWTPGGNDGGGSFSIAAAKRRA